MDGNYVKFQPNTAYLESLLSMGITENHAQEALYCTGNESVEAAVSYVFSNLIQDCNEDSVNDKPGTGSNLREDKVVDEDYEADESDEDAGEEGLDKQFKMTFVVNSELKMGVGKVAAQVAHACLGLYREMKQSSDMDEALNKWDYVGEKKIVLKVDNAEQLQELYGKAKELNVPCYLVTDAGHTQIPAGSITVLSVFGIENDVNAITGGLRLL